MSADITHLSRNSNDRGKKVGLSQDRYSFPNTEPSVNVNNGSNMLESFHF